MGSYAECWLSSFYVGSTKNEFDPAIMQLFRSSDKHVISGIKKEIPIQLRHWLNYVDDDEIVDVTFYSAPVNIIRDRLELQGYTFDVSKIAFTKWLRKEINSCEDFSHRKGGEIFIEKLNLLKKLDVESWLLSLKQIYDNTLTLRQRNHQPDEYDGTIIGYMLDKSNDWYGFPGTDLNIALRLVLEILPDVDELIYDVTDLVLSEYYSKDDDLVQLAIDWSANGYSSTGKVIVLTEGSTDTWIISESLQLLYPHLVDYFTFMDFDGARIGGGAGSLANIIKAFSGAGIINKVVALFDNDTAAATALRGIRLVQVPANIKIMQLPELKFLENYPTIGPSGLATMNVNTLAASIELYLGSDILVDENGDIYPVQWAGYIPELGRYQGEVLSKEEIQKKFKQKILNCKADKSLLETTDWVGLKAILQNLFSSFHDLDQIEILSFVDISD